MASTQARTRARPQSPARRTPAPELVRDDDPWVAPGGTRVVAGRSIGDLVYVAPSVQPEWPPYLGRSAIDCSLPVADRGSDRSDVAPPYWPSYWLLSPPQRALYLDWLAGGRLDPACAPGYVFLYFYGLERRFLHDAATDAAERLLLIAEVERLLCSYGSHAALWKYLMTFLDWAVATTTPLADLRPSFDPVEGLAPLSVWAAIGHRLSRGEPLTADWLLSWYMTHPDRRLRKPAARAFPEFKARFTQLFNQRYPGGLTPPAPTRPLRSGYFAASQEFGVQLNNALGLVPDIQELTEPLRQAHQLSEAALSELNRYSRYLGRHPQGRGALEAHALLPASLRPLFPCAALDVLQRWTAEVIAAGGLVPAERLLAALDVDALTAGRWPEAARRLALLSVGVAPDPRFTTRGPPDDAPALLFQLPADAPEPAEPSRSYRFRLLAVAVGSFVARATQESSEQEPAAGAPERLAALVDAHQPAADRLTDAEERRLRAELRWRTAVPTGLADLRPVLRRPPAGAAAALGQVGAALAVADGVVDPRAVTALEQVYRILGLDRDDLYSALHALLYQDAPTLLGEPGPAEPGFGIPAPPRDGLGPDGLAQDGVVRLDDARIAAVRASTARVSAALADIFQEDIFLEDAPAFPEPASHPAPAGGVTGLDAEHGDLLRALLARDHWELDECAALASQHGLMLSGVVETLNEWAWARYGDLLLEEDQGYDLNPDLVPLLDPDPDPDVAS